MADTLFAYGFRKQGSEDTDELGDEDAGASKQEEDGETEEKIIQTRVVDQRYRTSN